MEGEAMTEHGREAKLRERVDEGLETLYALRERGLFDPEAFLRECPESDPERLLIDMRKEGLITRDPDEIGFTEAGLTRAEGVIRRHRLAEVLMRSILEASEEEMEETACAFEHLVSEGAVERVCAFLGHPHLCPHGRSIPPGRCCALTADNRERIQPLSEIGVGEICEVIHIRPRHHARLDRLAAFGLVPRSVVKLHQKRPSFVVQIDETDLALDLDIARDIFVRLRS
jgi:DtxR family transcriptional regulator, Mn-dependent transcriptional regulator